MHIELPYGKTKLTAELPDGLDVSVLDMPATKVDKTEEEMIDAAMRNPIGSPLLEDMLKPDDTVVIVVNDQTRPGPNVLIMSELMKRLDMVGVPDENVTIIFATGSHRAPTAEEARKILGDEAYSRFKTVDHHCMVDEENKYIGDTKAGIPVYINKVAAECSFLITTGLITQHHCAGYSGGRKSIVPGIAGFTTFHIHHSFPVYQYEPAMGFMHGNPFHNMAVDAARTANVRFIVNAVQDAHKKVVGFVAGDLEAAHEEGVKLCESVTMLEVDKPADILISSPGGFPRDIDLYQSQKAISVSELICNPNCVFVLVAECSDGFGGGSFRQIMVDHADPDEIIDLYAREGFTPGSNKAFNYARALKKGRVIIVSPHLSKESVEEAHLEWAGTLQEAVDSALEGRKDPVVAVIPSASGLCARVRKQD
ncbi:MAG: nickel-dependent lactate racemase [Oscillospiraceae bacterium]|nr:nickel-dependent lactate racemase [Oscillospiraceae bacterium]